MSFAAEPYGTFVEDLLANLTGGVSRVRCCASVLRAA